MTIATELRRAGPYAGNGLAVAFPFSFKVFAAGDVLVVRTDEDGDTELVLTTDYAVSLNSAQDAVPGGTVTLLSPLPSGTQLTILSRVAALQPTELTNQGGFYPQVITRALDRATILIQQQAEKLARSLVLSPTETEVSIAAPSLRRGGKILGFNRDTGAFEVQGGDAFIGAPGAADNTYVSMLAFKASDIGRKTASLVGVPGVPDGRFNWTAGNYSATPIADLDLNIVKANSTPLTAGAWVRQRATGIALTLGSGAPIVDAETSVRARAINMRDEGAALDGVTDDSAAFVRALARGREIIIPGRMYINTTISLPDRPKLTGYGSQRSAIVLGPNGFLKMEGPGFAIPSDPGSLQPFGRAVFRDLGFSTADPVGTLTLPNLLFWKVQHISFVDCLFYHTWVNLDNHRYVSFLKCEFYTGRGSGLLSQCSFQPSGGQFINECLIVDACHHSGGGWELRDTVEPRFSKTTFFGGAFGIRSYRQFATGTAQTPFYMGPIADTCTFDAIIGFGIDVDGGGTNCRVVGNFFSAGRVKGQSVAAPGVRFTNSQGVEFVGNHFEWCGLHGAVLAACSKFTIAANTFLNMASGSGLYITQSSKMLITANVFENLSLWGGSGDGNTNLAIETPANDLMDSYVVGNSISGMKNALGLYAEGNGNRVFANLGAPITSERNWAPAKSGGWTAATGTALRGAYATYAGGSVTYGATQDNALRDVSQRVKAMEDALRSNQIIDG